MFMGFRRHLSKWQCILKRPVSTCSTYSQSCPTILLLQHLTEFLLLCLCFTHLLSKLLPFSNIDSMNGNDAKPLLRFQGNNNNTAIQITFRLLQYTFHASAIKQNLNA